MGKMILRSIIALSLLLLGGCTGVSRYNFGIRPDEPRFFSADPQDCTSASRASVCEEFRRYAQYSIDLEEAYYSRATQNRAWIYVSGTTALGTAAATAGVAAVAANPTVLALLPISGAFASGFFGVLDNSTLADIYTIAACKIEVARQKAEEMLIVENGSRYKDPDACGRAYDHLRKEVAEAKNNLERARTNSAMAAIQRTAEQTKLFNETIEKAQAPKEATTAKITAVNPQKVSAGKQEKITLTVSQANWQSMTREKLKVLIGNETQNVDEILIDKSGSDFLIEFRTPPQPPSKGKKDYPLTLVVDGKTTIHCVPSAVLTYK